MYFTGFKPPVCRRGNIVVPSVNRKLPNHILFLQKMEVLPSHLVNIFLNHIIPYGTHPEDKGP
jgi:hypothetical protein